eukprot:2715310-Prymnesium_polylepis.1
MVYSAAPKRAWSAQYRLASSERPHLYYNIAVVDGLQRTPFSPFSSPANVTRQSHAPMTHEPCPNFQAPTRRGSRSDLPLQYELCERCSCEAAELSAAWTTIVSKPPRSISGRPSCSPNGFTIPPVLQSWWPAASR